MSHLTGMVVGQSSGSTLSDQQDSGDMIANTAASKSFRRAYKACINCRKRKVKCDFGDVANPSRPPCRRCKREGKECEFVASRRGGIRNVLAGREKKARELGFDGMGINKANDTLSGRELYNTSDALEILAHAARTFPKISVDGTTANSAASAAPSSSAGTAAGTSRFAVSSANTSGESHINGVLKREESTGELANVPHTASENGQGDQASNSENHDPLHESNGHHQNDGHHQSHHSHASIGGAGAGGVGLPGTGLHGALGESEGSGTVTPLFSKSHKGGERFGAPTKKLQDSELIVKEHILTEAQARMLISFFFEKLHPFYPFIPTELHNPDHIADMPIFLAAITTLASRYYTADQILTEESMEMWQTIHSNLWSYCQKLISKTVWAEASTRSIGTVFTFLLFSEWNPRAIHQRGHDYANDPDNWGISFGDVQPQMGGRINVDGLSAARRSDRMSWLLIGSGIRLAQDLGLMETDPQVYLAIHLSEIVLALRMGRRSMLGQFLNDPVPNMQFTPVQQCKLDLLQIMSLAHETLYSSRETTRELLKNGRYLSFLGLFSPHLTSWQRRFSEVMTEQIPFLERESLLFDYHYTRLYIYSLALVSTSDTPNTLGAVVEIIPSARYVAMATDAAKELLAVANQVHHMKFLKHAPIRWIVRIVHATVFLLKTLMLSHSLASREAQLRTITTIHTISNTLLEASPDDIHLSCRYGKILGNLCSQLSDRLHWKRRSANSSGGQTPVNNKHPVHNTAAGAASKLQQEHDRQASENPTHQHSQQNGNGTDDQHAELQDSQEPIAQNESLQSHMDQQHVGSQSMEQDIQESMLENSGYDLQLQDLDNCDLLSMLDVNFDFLEEGTEGLGFVEPLMEGIEQQQWLQEKHAR